MPAPNPIRTTALLTAPHSPRSWYATLPNGKPVIAHLPTRHLAAQADLAVGQTVGLEITAYDFSAGRISLGDAGKA